MDYHLRPLNPNPSITIVGCGGTGGFVAESLCRLFTGREADIVLVDHDRVEPHNLLRQNFTEGNLGEYKSQALAERLARTYRRTVGYSTRPFEALSTNSWQTTYPGIKSHGQSMIIGCVDNARARKEMAQSIRKYTNTWLIDAGNGDNWGQILVGNTTFTGDLGGSFQDSQCVQLPAPTVQSPALLTTAPKTKPDIDCAAALDLTDQDPAINQIMASLVTAVVRRMAAGTCPWMALRVDMDLGILTPSYANPETVSKITGVPVETLVSANARPQEMEDGRRRRRRRRRRRLADMQRHPNRVKQPRHRI